MNDTFRSTDITITKDDLETAIQEFEEGGFELISLTKATIAGEEKNLLTFDPRTAPLTGNVVLKPTPENITDEDDGGFFAGLRTQGFSIISFADVFIESNSTPMVACRPGAAPAVPAEKPSGATKSVAELKEQIMTIAANSELAAHTWWKGQDKAPIGYIKGMALVYARVYCKLKKEDDAAKDMAKANSGNAKDALTVFRQQFINAVLKNDKDGDATLRHVFMILIGLAMPESGGKWNEGIDKIAEKKRKENGTLTADNTEAGLFQTSWDAHTASPLMPKLFALYKAETDPSAAGFLEVFKEGVTGSDIVNVPGGQGEEFQHLSKICPAFTAEFTAVGLRHDVGHWGTISSGLLEFRPEADTLFKAVQKAVDASGVEMI